MINILQLELLLATHINDNYISSDIESSYHGIEGSRFGGEHFYSTKSRNKLTKKINYERIPPNCKKKYVVNDYTVYIESFKRSKSYTGTWGIYKGNKVTVNKSVVISLSLLIKLFIS